MELHFITGSTGFVGRELLKKLLNENKSVVLLIRGENYEYSLNKVKRIFGEYFYKYSKNIKILNGDIEKENLGISQNEIQGLKSNEIIFWHLAANLSFSKSQKDNVFKTNYDGTINVCKFSNLFAKKLFYVSTAYVSGDAKHFTENDLDKGQKHRNTYEKSKFEAEKYLRGNIKIPMIVFRPSVIIGKAYKGKAEGCTFGYYRYLYVFYFLKQQIIKTLRKKNLVSKFLVYFKTKYNDVSKVLLIPILYLPFPLNGKVNFVTIEDVIDSMIKVYKKNVKNLTIHITNDHPADFKTILNAVLIDLGYDKFKLVPVSKNVFNIILKIFYYLGFGIKKYTISIMWYVPYFTNYCKYDRRNAKMYTICPKIIDEKTINKINKYAKDKILNQIVI